MQLLGTLGKRIDAVFVALGDNGDFVVHGGDGAGMLTLHVTEVFDPVLRFFAALRRGEGLGFKAGFGHVYLRFKGGLK